MVLLREGGFGWDWVWFFGVGVWGGSLSFRGGGLGLFIGFGKGVGVGGLVLLLFVCLRGACVIWKKEMGEGGYSAMERAKRELPQGGENLWAIFGILQKCVGEVSDRALSVVIGFRM